ncbi:uncharacterized protein Tco025E_01949 [Trypanosoma conorhini]|uniref:Methyltransferase n=1 Tax=Trypanosoma conorhini TaxID=83891 RepID=A0A422Q745_9TRYP|nr:uncharacterized protein Tco025E_01949 [Trypanosoma conorhini]RNF25757.1 hypothetical protein Tco025E_01949 [Trypanosoma conorhini]
MQKKIIDGNSAEGLGYEPVVIPREKYAKVVHGRNIFLVTCFGGAALVWGMSLIPQWLMYRSLRRMYQTYCRGRVLDLTPKIADAKDVSFYEMSKAVRVEFIVDQKVVDDGRYKIDATLPEAVQAERRKAMTLDFMVKNDHNWVGSTVVFDLIERRETELPDFHRYDTVVIRNELLNRTETDARQMLNAASTYVSKDGYVLLMDFGSPSWPTLLSAVRWFNSLTRSSMHLTHDYNKWIREDARYSLVEEHRCLMGFHYALALRPKS